VLVVAACGGKTAGPAAPIGNTSHLAVHAVDQSIRRIDWLNRAYDYDGRSYSMVNGDTDLLYDAQDNVYSQDEWDQRYPGKDPVTRGWIAIGDPIYTDVDHDRSEDALITIRSNTGGTGKFDYVELYALRDGAPTVIDSIPGGDRADGGIGALSVDDSGDILVERYVNTGDGACCPRASQHEVWRWTDAGIAEDVARRTGPTPIDRS